MEIVRFNAFVVSVTADGAVLVALMDDDDGAAPFAAGQCVGIISSDPETMRALCSHVGSILKAQEGQ